MTAPRSLVWLFFSLAAFAAPSPARAGLFEGDHPLVREGTEAYDKGDYEGALRAFEEASRELPDRAELQYNLGDVYMKLGRADDAKRAYQAALGGAPEALRAQDYYNLGNALASLNQRADAVAAYRQALKVDPAFEPARHNLEVLLRKPPESKPSPGDGGQGDAGGDGGQNPDGGRQKDRPDGGLDSGADSGDPSGDGGGRDGQAAGDGGGGAGADGSRADGGTDAGASENQDEGETDAGADGGSKDASPQANQPQEQPPANTDPKKVDQQEAERLLDAMRRNEKQFLMQQHTKKAKARGHPDRDW